MEDMCGEKSNAINCSFDRVRDRLCNFWFILVVSTDWGKFVYNIMKTGHRGGLGSSLSKNCGQISPSKSKLSSSLVDHCSLGSLPESSTGTGF